MTIPFTSAATHTSTPACIDTGLKWEQTFSRNVKKKKVEKNAKEQKVVKNLKCYILAH